ncbi:hypothetical protein BDZ89DRAFT_580689 [Hymenopellis radicata]|nr:hypothetical protein BDZ89DRAFT_580689 [Hymenopellis radicata]
MGIHRNWRITCPVEQCERSYPHEPSLKRHIRGKHVTLIERLVEELFHRTPTNGISSHNPSVPIPDNNTVFGVPTSYAFCTGCHREIETNSDN